MCWAFKKLHCESKTPVHFAIMGNEQLLAIFFLWCRTTEEAERLIKETIGKTHMQDDGSLHQGSFGRGVWIGNYFGSLISQIYWWIKSMNGRNWERLQRVWLEQLGVYKWHFLKQKRIKGVWLRIHSSVLGIEWFFSLLTPNMCYLFQHCFSSIPTSTRCRTIQFNSDTSYLELVSDITGLRTQSHRTAFISGANHKCQVTILPANQL